MFRNIPGKLQTPQGKVRESQGESRGVKRCVYGPYMVLISSLYPAYMLFVFFVGRSNLAFPVDSCNACNLFVCFVPALYPKTSTAWFIDQ